MDKHCVRRVVRSVPRVRGARVRLQGKNLERICLQRVSCCLGGCKHQSGGLRVITIGVDGDASADAWAATVLTCGRVQGSIGNIVRVDVDQM